MGKLEFKTPGAPLMGYPNIYVSFTSRTHTNPHSEYQKKILFMIPAEYKKTKPFENMLENSDFKAYPQVKLFYQSPICWGFIRIQPI